MTNYFVRSLNATPTAPYDTWAKAAVDLVTISGNGVIPTVCAAGDTIFVADDHNETSTGADSIHLWPGLHNSPNLILCVDHTVANPTAADLKTTAVVSLTGNYRLSMEGSYYCYGITFNVGENVAWIGTGVSEVVVYEQCSWRRSVTTGGAAAFFFQSILSETFINTTFQCAATTDRMTISTDLFEWRGSASGFIGSTFPASVWTSPVNINTTVRGVDLSNLTTTDLGGIFSGTVYYYDCKMPSGYTITCGAHDSTQGGGAVIVSRSDSSTSTLRLEKYMVNGSQVNDTSIVRTAGASIGATAISAHVTTTATASWIYPFECLPIIMQNTKTGSSVTATIYGIINAAAVPTNNEVWIEIGELGSALTPISTLVNTRPATVLTAPASCAADTSAWDSLVTARQNSTSYSVGQVIKVASNPGRVFFCTTSGSTDGTEPAGYASAVDGGSVTETAGAVFRAGCRFSIGASFTAAMIGAYYTTVYSGKASQSVYIDPLPVKL